MPHSLKNKIKSLCYKGELSEKERDRIIQALEQQPSEDCISRESVIEWLKDKDIIKTKNQEENARKELAFLSSVIPQSKIGHWIRTRTWEHDGELYCSKCGFVPHDERDCHNFCPNCGAKMESVTPQPKIGHWIIIDDCEQFIAKCSECGRIEDSRMINKYPYCHCGAKMEVTNE